MEHALTNLAGYYQDEGLLERATDLLLKAEKVSRTSGTLIKVLQQHEISGYCR